jgi:outer membrane protein assembly factor BamD
MKTKCLILLMFLLASCVSYDHHDTSKASGAFGLAKQLEDDERFEEALPQYRDVKNRFPYSKYAVLAELQMAEIYYKKEDFAQAQGAYQLFKELHPRHPKIDYVTFKIGESLYMQLPSTVDRDMTQAPGAIKEFEVLMRDFPNSPHVPEAKKRRLEVIRKLAEKELYIADFYFRTDVWQSAIVRYEKYLKEFPQHDKRPRALLRAGIAADKFGDTPKSNSLLRQLVESYPNSKEAKKAKEML